VTRAAVERRARWVLDTIGATELGFGDDVPYVEPAWEQVELGELPDDPLAAAFFHLARVEERRGPRDEHGRFPAAASVLDPLELPLERLRRSLGVEPRSWGGARFAVALTHDVDLVWRWADRRALRGALARLRHGDLAELTALARAPLHRVRGTDPYWRFEDLLEAERDRGVRSTFYVLGGHLHPADGRDFGPLRARLVEVLSDWDAEIGLHPSYTAAEDLDVLAAEKRALEALAGPIDGLRYHYLRVDPHRNMAPLRALGIAHDSSLGWAETLGFRAGIAQAFRPWGFERDEPLDLVEIPLAAMDATLAEPRYLGLSVAEAEHRLVGLLDVAAEHGGAFSVVWHTERFDPGSARGWDRLWFRFIDAVRERGGVCLTAGELAQEAQAALA
jgi:peptidoglycan/xylan/chitin deacetylase (PgdA/CDA1 family)